MMSLEFILVVLQYYLETLKCELNLDIRLSYSQEKNYEPNQG